MESDHAKKLEKLNLRVGELERDSFEKARTLAGFASVSSWARHVLSTQAQATLNVSPKASRDLAICLAGEGISFGTNDLTEEAFEVSIPAGVIVEGNVLDVETCKRVIRDGVARMSERYDLSHSHVLVTGRILPSTLRFIKDLVSESTGMRKVFTIQFSMANAIGVGLDVTGADPQGLISIESDWIEMANICGAGLKAQRSFGWHEPMTSAEGRISCLRELIRARVEELETTTALRVVVDQRGKLKMTEALEDLPGVMVDEIEWPALLGARRALPTVRQMFP